MKLRVRLLIIMLLVVGGHARAQLIQPNFKKIGNNEGLSGMIVLSMVQDSRDLYWIGTLNGLQMFDGREFTRYPLPFSQNGVLGSNSISQLLVDGDSILWVAHYQGIARFNLYTRTFTYISVPKETPSQTLAITNIFRDRDGGVWCTSFELGLIRYNESLKKFEKAGGALLQSQKRVKAYELEGDYMLICHMQGCGIFSKSKNRLLLDHEIDAKYSWVKNPVIKGEVFEAFLIGDTVYAQIWSHEALSYEFVRLNCKDGKYVKGGLKTISGRKSFRDRSGNVWLYGDGLTVLTGQTGELIDIRENVKEGVQFDFTMAQRMFEDKENNIWICTNVGLYVFNREEHPAKVCNDLDQDGFIKHAYNSICELRNGEVWTGTFGEGLLIHDSNLELQRKTDLSKSTGDPHFNLIWSLYEASDSKIWVGCQRGRLVCFDQAENKYQYFNDSTFELKTLMSITEDPQGNVYIGTNGGTIIRVKKGGSSFERVFKSAELANRSAAGTITSMFCHGGKLYAGTNYDGLVVIDLVTLKPEHHRLDPHSQGGLKSNNVFALLPDGDKGFYAGTSNGLGYYSYQQSQFSFFTLYDGLPFSNVYDLVNAGQGELLASTSDGLYRISWKDRSFQRMARNSNLYRGFNAVKMRNDMSALLLANDDFFYSLPVRREPRKVQPRSFIFKISSINKTYHLTKEPQEIKFDKDNNTVSFTFGASSYKYHNSVDYYYMLTGVDQDWLPAGANRTVTYSKLKGGNYTFKLKCVFQEDKNSFEELSVPFKIARPFNQTVWFYLLIFAMICTMFYLIYRIRVNRLLEIEKIRFGLSRDLHDDMGSTLSTINILSVIAGEKLEKDSRLSADYLKRITSISEQMMESMDDIIWSINPVNDNMERVIIRMREFAAGMLEPQDIALIFESDRRVAEIGIQMRWRRDFFLIFKEAINNAAKYSHANQVKVNIFLSGRAVVLSIADNGRGFQMASAAAGNGIINMNKRAADIGGTISINSVPGEGTTITLTVPLNKLNV
jgi:ligand-binding sensor domain-containing protein/two-component sensor histidine kinase